MLHLLSSKTYYDTLDCATFIIFNIDRNFYVVTQGTVPARALGYMMKARELICEGKDPGLPPANVIYNGYEVKDQNVFSIIMGRAEGDRILFPINIVEHITQKPYDDFPYGGYHMPLLTYEKRDDIISYIKANTGYLPRRI